MTKIHILSLCFALMYLISSCGGKSTNPPQTEEIIVLQPTPVFNADSAYLFVAAQVKFGKRVPNTEAHRKCADYLVEQLRSFGFQTEVQAFEAIAYNGNKLQSKNIIGKFNPTAAKRILLAAHWDSRPFNDKEAKDSTKFEPIDGANDGASGVGVLLEIARAIAMAEKKPQVGVDIIFFDSEDYGQPENYQGQYKPDMWCLGSQYWSKNKGNYQAYFGILLDMVGGKNAQFWREGSSLQYAREITQNTWRVGNQLGYSSYFILKDAPAITDDHSYVNTIAKIPMLDIIEYDPANSDTFFAHYHHTSKDNMEIIDKNTLKAVGQTVLQVVYNEQVTVQ